MTPVSAQVAKKWFGTGVPTYFHLPENWDPAGTPGPLDDVEFNLQAQYEVLWNSQTMSAAPSIGTLRIDRDDVLFLNDEPTQVWELIVNGSGGAGSFTDVEVTGASGGDTFLFLAGIRLRSLGGAQVDQLGYLLIDGTLPYSSEFVVEGSVGFCNDGYVAATSGGQITSTFSYIGYADGTEAVAIVDGTDGNGTPSGWHTSQTLIVGREGNATMEVTNGGYVSSNFAAIASMEETTSQVSVSGVSQGGSSSTWENDGNIHVGNFGKGVLTISNGGVVSDDVGFIGYHPGSMGEVVVSGVGSLWHNRVNADVGEFGSGSLLIEEGGRVENIHGFIGYETGSSGEVVIHGAGSTWANTGNVVIGGNNDSAAGPGTLNVYDQGRLEVGGVLKIWSTSAVTLDGGSIVTNSFDNSNGGLFNFVTGSLTVNSGVEIGVGTGLSQNLVLTENRQLTTPAVTTIAPFHSVTIDGGVLRTGALDIQGTLNFNSGTLEITGASGLTVGTDGPLGSTVSLTTGQQLVVTNMIAVNFGATFALNGGSVSASLIDNTGRLSGAGTIAGTLQNNVDGEVEILSGRQLHFAGSFSNFGEVNNFGGQVRFDGQFINNDTGNNDTGFVAGRGQFIADGGWTNQGAMAFSAGLTDVKGDVFNDIGGRIVTSGGATTTFFDDVTHNGDEIRTAAGSNTVFLGAATGSGPYTGTGTVYFEGDLRPGNSPSTIQMDGDVVFGNSLTSEFEIGGLSNGELDQLGVAGTAVLDGTLQVSLLAPFDPQLGDVFDILLAAEGVAGKFSSAQLPDLGSLLAMDVFYDTNAVTLAVVPVLAGDYNADGKVNIADYTIWRNLLGETGLGLSADGNRDGVVSLMDYDGVENELRCHAAAAWLARGTSWPISGARTTVVHNCNICISLCDLVCVQTTDDV
ncbi:dockerin type I domain-containing protein [Aeoliella sp. ICT_H6.2]|uniref:Dockerin type I domain-containing protein n=1 Tax=Aeoliella straminimaris TaxID=2954799 RepID=A0A9X2FD37_9BACT|nr:dockerin type I domain-containing protein [Aeoliella straminimaris]MCO6044074.1 dockerin type I domain-containing protein [Aeoliella straminimaris]